jgi:hypothetical protein
MSEPSNPWKDLDIPPEEWLETQRQAIVDKLDFSASRNADGTLLWWDDEFNDALRACLQSQDSLIHAVYTICRVIGRMLEVMPYGAKETAMQTLLQLGAEDKIKLPETPPTSY